MPLLIVDCCILLIAFFVTVLMHFTTNKIFSRTVTALIFAHRKKDVLFVKNTNIYIVSAKRLK